MAEGQVPGVITEVAPAVADCISDAVTPGVTRILLKIKTNGISHLSSLVQMSWLGWCCSGVESTSQHPQLIPENITDYVISV